MTGEGDRGTVGTALGLLRTLNLAPSKKRRPATSSLVAMTWWIWGEAASLNQTLVEWDGSSARW